MIPCYITYTIAFLKETTFILLFAFETECSS